jgi:hypothetical protein
MKVVSLFALLGFCLGSTGCALVPIPVPRTYPGPVRGVRVLDAESGQPLPAAEVAFEVEPVTNWTMTFPPSFGAVREPRPDPTDLPDPAAAKPAQDKKDADNPVVQGMTEWLEMNPFALDGQPRQLGVARQPDGLFVVDRSWTVGTVRPWGPGPLGWALYNDWRVHITAGAPGYPGAVLAYFPANPPPPGWESKPDVASRRAEVRPVVAVDGWSCLGGQAPPSVGRCRMTAEGIVEFYLQRQRDSGCTATAPR